MHKRMLILLSLLFLASSAQALRDSLIEVELQRKDAGSPVFQRAILSQPDTVNLQTALLYFRSGHGMAKISSIEDRRRNYSLFIGPLLQNYFQSGIATVVVDCPTDQWGPVGDSNRATSCLDGYRSSTQHADDVRAVIARLRQDHGIRRFFLLGHSKGTISSQWLAVHLGEEISGSIHSASLSGPDTWGNGESLRNLPLDAIKSPALWLHHLNDACPVTRYADTKRRAGERLTTVRGGSPEGQVCSLHYHSYQGREAVAAKAIIDWINTGTTAPFVGDP